jgi:cyclic beta-1,2-glucan synthetase
VLDPIVAIRYRITLDPEQSVTIDMVSGIAETRDMASAWSINTRTTSRRPRFRPGLDAQPGGAAPAQCQRGRCATARPPGQFGHLRQCRPLRADAGVLVQNRRGQSGLWGYAISGDLPIVLLQIGDAANIDLVRQLVQAHAYWRLKGWRSIW